MGDHSAIEWTDATWSVVTGCTRISPGCENCYAERLSATRLREHPKYIGVATLNLGGEPRWSGHIRLHEDLLSEPMRWRKPRRVFVCSMSDLFHDAVPPEFIGRVMNVIGSCPQHQFQVLTKRPEYMRDVLQEYYSTIGQGPFPNLWAGTSVETQLYADTRIPFLLQTLAAIRFLSCEPLLGSVDLDRHLWRDLGLDEIPGYALNDGMTAGVERRRPGIDWCIVGGESGPGARPMNEDWVRAIRDQSQAAGVAFFYKQKVVNGRKIGLPELDGLVWNEFPEARA